MRKNLHRSNVVLQPLVKVGGREEKVADSGEKKKKEERKGRGNVVRGKKRGRKWKYEKPSIPAGIKLRGITRMSAGIVALSLSAPTLLPKY